MTLRLKPLFGRRDKLPGKYEVLGLPGDLEGRIAPIGGHWSYLLIERGCGLEWKGDFATPADALKALGAELAQRGK